MVIKEAGVYQIRNIINNAIYVGSTVNLHKRWLSHKNALRKGRSVHKILQNAWNKYGEESFVFETLEKFFHKSFLIKLEQFYIDNLEPEYNICSIAGAPMANREFTKGHCERISRALSGVKKSLEHNAAVGAALLGHKHSKETRLKISETRKRERIGCGENNPFYGRKHSEESKKKMSIAVTNRRK